MTDFAVEVARRLSEIEQRGVTLRFGTVTAVAAAAGSVNRVVTVDGKRMPILKTGETIAVGDVVAYLDVVGNRLALGEVDDT